MLQFKHRGLQRLLFLFWKSRSRIVFHTKVWSLLLPDSSRYLRRKSYHSLLLLEASILQLVFTLYWRKNNPKFSFISWFPSPTPDLFEVAPCSTLLPIPLPSPYTGSLQSRSLNQSLLPYHCLPLSLTSTRVLIGRVDECLRIK